MGKLHKQMRMRENAIRKRRKQTQFGRDPSLPKKEVAVRDGDKKKTVELPTFDINGKAVQPERKLKQKRLVMGSMIAVSVLMVVYLPQFIPKDMDGTDKEGITVNANHEAVRNCNVLLRDNPQEDFDDDGILNTDETSLGTDPWSIDTDGDGVTDYAELYITKTSPTEWTGVLEDMQMKLDKAEGKSIANPYSIGNVILWPDSYTSKSYGSVIEMENASYRFCDFTGSVLFPDSENKYAYRVEDDVHVLLPNDLTDHTWKVKAGDTIELYGEKLEEYFELRVFGLRKSFRANQFLSVVDIILPSEGWITARKMTELDLLKQTDESIENEIEKPFFNENDSKRLQNNMISISALNQVREAIRAGKCVAVSIFSSTEGEYLGILYGLTDKGNFLCADMDTKEKTGEILIREKAEKILNESGEIVSNLTFDFDGFGFSSKSGDRISFFAFTK